MFTVMICGKEFYKATKEHHSHLLDLMAHNKDCALLTWKTDADTLEEAVPGLDEATAGQVQWRAVVVTDSDTFGFDHVNRQNPFDAVDAVKALVNFGEERIFDLMDEHQVIRCDLAALEKDGGKGSAEYADLAEREALLREEISDLIAKSKEEIESFRRRKKENYCKACTNPLTRLSVWMLGAPAQEMLAPDLSWPEELLAEDVPVDWNYFEAFRKFGIFPSEIEKFKADSEKQKALASNFLGDSMLQKKPSEVLVVSERFLKRSDDIFEQVKVHHEEIEYDNFCDDNLYPAGLSYVLYDVEYDNQRRSLSSHLEFVSFIYLLSRSGFSKEWTRPERVYNGKVTINEQKARDFFTKYLRKLDVTKRLLLRKLKQYDTVAPEDELPAAEAVEIFETDVEIPVEDRLSCGEDAFLATYKIGLSRDCPVEEEASWTVQVNEITKKFIRFLREPRRALKNAVKKDFKAKSVVEDERISRLSEDSLEDIEFRIQEKEQQMVETVTNRLYKTKEYTDRIEKADRTVREQITRRMTRRKTVWIGMIVLFAYLLGFIPLFIGNSNDSKTLSTALLLAGGALVLMVLVGLVFLWIVRVLHKRNFDAFNDTMRDIFNEIKDGLARFSSYLGKMCDAMRGISVFNYLKKPTDQTPKILKKHLYDVQMRIDGVNGLFVSVMQMDRKNDEMPYNYDFTKLADYPYEVPYEEAESLVEFVASGNYVSVPVDYIEKVTLTREELYD